MRMNLNQSCSSAFTHSGVQNQEADGEDDWTEVSTTECKQHHHGKSYLQSPLTHSAWLWRNKPKEEETSNTDIQPAKTDDSTNQAMSKHLHSTESYLVKASVLNRNGECSNEELKCPSVWIWIRVFTAELVLKKKIQFVLNDYLKRKHSMPSGILTL